MFACTSICLFLPVMKEKKGKGIQDLRTFPNNKKRGYIPS
ncbi:hypothetical protein BTH41_04867 [Bacillus mycoides]|nr:hypothetical protein BTH41_04867 [Bacillus mycoides]